ncbi:MAG: DUF3368 domain-containing protein [Azoarcus sp.]|jgi:predicted nucleic acid-binding protein|nr:DUF3368 domain-containing protein [Azoarcus sp.]
MSRRVVIADAGPLIALARIELLGLLRKLFGQIIITSAIRNEILPPESTFSDTGLLLRTLDEGWIEVVDALQDGWMPLNPGVDPGEASAIRIARHWRDKGKAVLLAIDDYAGRREAEAQGITVIGTAAIIGLFKTEGLIPAASPQLERLVKSGYFIGPSVIAAVLAETGEAA